MRTTDGQRIHHDSNEVSRPSHPQDLRTMTLSILTVTRVIPGSVRAVQAHAAGGSSRTGSPDHPTMLGAVPTGLAGPCH